MTATGILAMRRAKWMEVHTCNAYCRGEQHADVFFVDTNDPDPLDALRTPLTALGWQLVHMEPAPEIEDGPGRDDIDEWGRIRPGVPNGGVYSPWLVVWQ